VMKILEVVFDGQFAGAQVWIYNFLKWLKKVDLEGIFKHLDVELVVAKNGDFLRKVLDEGLVRKVYNLNFPYEVGLKDVISFFKMLKVIEISSPDVIHVHTSKMAALVRLAVFFRTFFEKGLWSGGENYPKVVYHVHGFYFKRPGISKIYELIEKILIKCTDAFICVNEDDWKWLNDLGVKKAYLVKNFGMFNYENINEGIRLNKFTDRNIDILWASRLAEPKDVDTLIALCEEFRDFNVVVAGSGDKRYEEQLRRIDNLGWVKYLGYVERERLFSLYAKSKVHLLLSRAEAHPLSVLEAASFGTPTVGWKVKGMGDVEYMGLSVDYGDLEHLYRLLRKVLKNPVEWNVFSKRAIKLVGEERQENFLSVIKIFEKVV